MLSCRMVFASGIVQSCGQAAGEVASALAAHWALTCSAMWNSLATALEATLTLPGSSLKDSMAAADTWATETGVCAATRLRKPPHCADGPHA